MVFDMCLENLLMPIISTAPVNVSMLIKNLDSHQILFSHKADLCIPSASIIKLLILIEAFSQLEKGTYGRNQRVPVYGKSIVDSSYIKELGLTSCSYYELMRQMIITSDNTATNILIECLGMDQINHWCDVLELKDTQLLRYMMDQDAVREGRENTTSCLDIATLLERIYRESILTTQSCKEIIHILLQQRDTSCLMRYIFDKVSVAHKTGNLDYVCHDCGIFYTDKGDYTVCIMTSGHQAGILGEPVIGQLMREFYRSEIGGDVL